MSGQTPQPKPEQEAAQTSQRQYICNHCGHEMYDHNCKMICPNCGSRFDCSDLNTYFD